MKQFFYLLLFFLILNTNLYGQEKVLVNGQDSVVVTQKQIPDNLLEDMSSFQFGEEAKEFSPEKYGVLIFNDEERRIFKSADRIKIKLFNDSVFVGDIGNVFFKNPGPTEILELSIEPMKDGKVIALPGDKAVTKITFLKKPHVEAVFTNDKIVFGILAIVLALIFYTSGLKNKNWKRFYTFIPALFLCYMIPAALTSFNIIDPEATSLYYMASQYLLPGSLILLILSVDIKALFGLGSKSLIMFFTGTIGIVIGGVFSVWLFSFFSPEVVGGTGNEAAWRGFATIAGSWIGGGANQSAMLEIYKYKDSLFGGMLLVDIVVANIWMAVILFGIGRKAKLDRWFKADNTAIDKLVTKVENFQQSVQRKATLSDFMVILGLVFGGVAMAHFLGGYLSDYFLDRLGKGNTLSSQFFWMVVISTFYGLLISFSKAKNYEGVGASKIGSVFLYILVATIGMKVDISKVFDEPQLILVGLVWIAVHAVLLIVVAKIIRAPFFFLAVGSQANVGGAASAPIIANAFHPALTTVGVLMAVFGYFIGTFGAILTAELMQMVAPI